MSPNLAAGPDGMNGKFFQCCWEIIKRDLIRMVQYFFYGNSMPKYFSHACLVLLPKVDHPNKISLSNFTNISSLTFRFQTCTYSAFSHFKKLVWIC